MLHENFVFDGRPLTVTGVFFKEDPSLRDSEPLIHQMLLDRVENNHYILKNNLVNGEYGGVELKINMKDHYYGDYEDLLYVKSCNNDQTNNYIYEKDGEKYKLANEELNPDVLEENRWYLFRQAYSISLEQLPMNAAYEFMRNTLF